MPKDLTDLRTQLAQALSKTATAGGLRLRELRFALADTAIAVFEGDTGQRLVDGMAERSRLRSIDFRDGMHMELALAEEITTGFVAAARTMLGDAENYSETKVSFDVNIAGSPETYSLVVQRVGKLTPHDARLIAEAERDQLRLDLASARNARITLPSLVALIDPAVHTANQIEAYLEACGWVQRAGYPLASDWRHPHHTPATDELGLLVPNRVGADYARRVAEIFVALADAAGVGELQVLADIATAGKGVRDA